MAATHCANNERIKRQYFAFLKGAKRYSLDTVNAVAAAIHTFESDTKFRDFKALHQSQIIAFTSRFTEQCSQVTGRKLSRGTVNGTLRHLKAFFQWLAGQPGYRSRLNYSDGEYFNLSEKETRVANARHDDYGPTLDQMHQVLSRMPSTTVIDRRNRALIAFILLTGARDRAVASIKLRHLNLADGLVYQDARDVQTKCSKSFITYFFPVGGDALAIVVAWVKYLTEELGWTGEDPLFPATEVIVGPDRLFSANGISRNHWSNADPIRKIFRDGFNRAGLPYFVPHSVRHTLVRLGESLCHSPEAFVAWSQNLGHEKVLTSFTSYGRVATARQGELVKNAASGRPYDQNQSDAVTEFARAVARELHGLRTAES